MPDSRHQTYPIQEQPSLWQGMFAWLCDVLFTIVQGYGPYLVNKQSLKSCSYLNSPETWRSTRMLFAHSSCPSPSTSWKHSAFLNLGMFWNILSCTYNRMVHIFFLQQPFSNGLNSFSRIDVGTSQTLLAVCVRFLKDLVQLLPAGLLLLKMKTPY